MSQAITLAELMQAVREEGDWPPERSATEYAGRLWSRLGGTDPDAAPGAPAQDVLDAAAMEAARGVIARRGMGDPVLSEQMVNQLAAYRDRLNRR